VSQCKAELHRCSFHCLFDGAHEAGNELVLRKSRTLFPTWSSVNQQEMQGTSSLSAISGSILSEFCWSCTPVVSFSTPGGFEVLGKCSENMENVYKSPRPLPGHL
jgi:hypothetical protein